MSFLKLGSKKQENSGAAVLNSNRPVNNINLYRQKGNFDDNVFITTYSKNKKLLVQISKDIFGELNNNRNRIKNHRILPIKSLLIKDEHIRFENFYGQVKIWLIFNQITQVLDYIIQIIPQEVFDNKLNQNKKKLINKLIREIDCEIILNTLKKFGINVDERRTENCKNFRWSFHLRDIPYKQIKLNNSNNNNNGTNFPYNRGPVILNPISPPNRVVSQPKLRPSSNLSRQPYF